MDIAHPSALQESAAAFAAADGFPLAGRVFAPPHARGVVVVASALGVAQRFYAGFARHLAERGFFALTFDYRGIAESRRGPQRGRDIRMQDWGSFDIDAAIRQAATLVPGRPVFLVGHSCGAQLPGLAAASEQLAGAVFVAGSAPHASLYPLRSQLLLGLLWGLLIPLLAAGRDEVPARAFGVSSGDFPSGVSRQWARWARTPGYLFDPTHGLDVSRYGRLALPVLALGFDDDDYVPPPAMEALLRRYARCAIERRWIAAGAHGGRLGHFGFFRQPALWPQVSEWLAARR